MHATYILHFAWGYDLHYDVYYYAIRDAWRIIKMWFSACKFSHKKLNSVFKVNSPKAIKLFYYLILLNLQASFIIKVKYLLCSPLKTHKKKEKKSSKNGKRNWICGDDAFLTCCCVFVEFNEEQQYFASFNSTQTCSRCCLEWLNLFYTCSPFFWIIRFVCWKFPAIMRCGRGGTLCGFIVL